MAHVSKLCCAKASLGSFEPLREGGPTVQPDSFSFNRRGLPLSIQILLLGVLVAFAGGMSIHGSRPNMAVLEVYQKTKALWSSGRHHPVVLTSTPFAVRQLRGC